MDGVLSHNELARREDTVRLGLWMFLATVAMLFAAFASAYIVRRSGSDWTPINLPAVLAVNTAILLASSLALELAVASGARNRWPSARIAIALSWLLGTGFLAGQVTAWRQLMLAGVYMPASPHSAFFYMLTAVHAIHVVAALGLLAVAVVRTWRIAAGSEGRRRWESLLGSTRTFWHFLLGIWGFVYVLLSTN